MVRISWMTTATKIPASQLTHEIWGLAWNTVLADYKRADCKQSNNSAQGAEMRRVLRRCHL